MVAVLVKKQKEARARDLGGGGAKYGGELQGKSHTMQPMQTMQAMQHMHAARDGDTASARTAVSSAGAQSLINYQNDASGATPLCMAAAYGHAAITKQLLKLDVTLIFRTRGVTRRSSSHFRLRSQPRR